MHPGELNELIRELVWKPGQRLLFNQGAMYLFPDENIVALWIPDQEEIRQFELSLSAA